MSLKIMIADDEPASLHIMKSLTTGLGHMVLTFDDSQKAGERAEKQRFDVVFLGMRMLELDGLKLIRQIRNSQTNHETTIVMLSATDDIESLRKAFDEGADFVLTKPVSSARLLPMLAAMQASGWNGRRDAMQTPGWNGKRHAARLPLFTMVDCKHGNQEFSLRSMNISESGMLLQPSLDVEVGEEISLQFSITEVGVSLNVRARIIRKYGTACVGVEFIGLVPEDLNAIQLYVMGRLRPKRNSPVIWQS